MLISQVHSDDGLDQWVDCKDCQAWFHYCCLAAPEEQSIRPRVRQAKIYAFKKYEMKNSPDYICTSCLRRDPSAVGGAPLAPKPMMARAVHPGAPRPLQCRNVQGLAPKPFQASPSNPAATKPAQRNTQLPGAPTRAQQVPAAPTAAPEPDQATDARAADPNPPKASVPLPAQAAAPVPWNRPDFKAAMKLAAARFEASLQAAPMYEQLVADGFNIAASRAWLSAHDAKPERLVLKVVPRDISNSAVHKSAMERVSKYCVDDAVTQKLAEAHRLTREAVQAGATQMLMDTLQALAHEMNGEDGMGVTVYNRGLLAKVLFKPPVQANCEPLDSNDADC